MKKYWFICLFVVLMLACNALTFPSSTPTPAIDFPSPVLVTPTSAESPPTSLAQPVSAIIARMAPGPFFLLGGTGNGEWLSPEMVLPHVADETYQIYGLGGPDGSANGEGPALDQICQLYRVDTDLVLPDDLSVGVAGNWEVTPRLVEGFLTDTPVYVDALTDWLVGKGFPDPVVEISQILRVDLEGDGTDEVLINASHFSEPSGHDVRSGDYSLVLMRKIVGASVATVPLVADYYYQVVENQFPLTYATTFPADLNNDGVLEVMVGVERWEGSGVMVYEINGTTISTVFEALCGL